MSDVCCLTSEVWRLMSHVWFQTSDVRCPMSNVLGLMSYVWFLVSCALWLMSDVLCLMFYVSCLMSYVWCLMSYHLCLMTVIAGEHTARWNGQQVCSNEKNYCPSGKVWSETSGNDSEVLHCSSTKVCSYLVCEIKWWRVKLGNNFSRSLSKRLGKLLGFG